MSDSIGELSTAVNGGSKELYCIPGFKCYLSTNCHVFVEYEIWHLYQELIYKNKQVGVQTNTNESFLLLRANRHLIFLFHRNA